MQSWCSFKIQGPCYAESLRMWHGACQDDTRQSSSCYCSVLGFGGEFSLQAQSGYQCKGGTARADHAASQLLSHPDKGLICTTKQSRIFSMPFSRTGFGPAVIGSPVCLDCGYIHWSWGILAVIRRRLWNFWQCKGIYSLLWCWLSAGQSSRLASPLCFQTGLLGDVCQGSYFGIATLLFCLVQNNPPQKEN